MKGTRNRELVWPGGGPGRLEGRAALHYGKDKRMDVAKPPDGAFAARG